MRLLSIFALFLLATSASAQVSTGDESLDEAFSAVLSKDFKAKLRGVDLIADGRHPKKK